MAMQMNPEFTKELSSPTNWALPNPQSSDGNTPPELVSYQTAEMPMLPPDATGMSMGLSPPNMSMQMQMSMGGTPPNLGMGMVPQQGDMGMVEMQNMQAMGMAPPDLAAMYAMPPMFEMDPSLM